ncbi:MAG: hypothetical protein NVS3B2_06030 [Ramlibacter sp.]
MRPKLPPAVPRPGGKLGLMIDLLARQDGASADELVVETGWQRHSVLGALSRLRTRGFLMQLVGSVGTGSRNYRLDVRVKRDDAG